MIYVNGKEKDNCNSLNALLDNGGFRREIIVVEINGEIIKKSNYDNTVLNDGDKVEIVSFVGGG